jgi:hypothetical protein
MRGDWAVQPSVVWVLVEAFEHDLPLPGPVTKYLCESSTARGCRCMSRRSSLASDAAESPASRTSSGSQVRAGRREVDRAVA